jgi:hypothetical protein
MRATLGLLALATALTTGCGPARQETPGPL